jgi:DNA (cytosine-5)-methyltransferase 1
VSRQNDFCFLDEWRAESYPVAKDGELVVDLFCGGGGASVGIEAAIGTAVDVAINHSADAIYYHERNHPTTDHFTTDVFDVNPVGATRGRPVGLLWLSPDCTHFSKAKGKAPKKKNIRSLATVGLWWARLVRPRVIVLENVEEFMTWGRLDKRTMQPDKRKTGEYFHKFVRRLRQHGYEVEWRVRKACDRGAPTIRKRFYLVARCDGQPIVWTKPTHGPGRKKPFHTAAECIDFSLPAVSIFATREECKSAGVRAVRPLADNTMTRVARGVWKYIINNPDPFIVPDQSPFVTEMANGSSQRNMDADEPLRTICAQVKGGHFALVSALLAKHYTGVTGSDVRVPLGAVTGIDHHSLVACHLERMHGTASGDSITDPAGAILGGGGHLGLVACHLEQMNGESTGVSVANPVTAITAQVNKHALVTSHLMKYHKTQGNESRCHDLRDPIPTIDGSNRVAEVRAFLIKYYGQGCGQVLTDPIGTVTGNDRFGLVVVKGELYQITDILLRMLTPDELLRCQFGHFADGYKIDGLTKTKAVKMIGNSVCPTEAYDIVKANFKRRTANQVREQGSRSACGTEVAA